MAIGAVLAEGTPTELKIRFCIAENPQPTTEDACIGFIEARGATS